jgi:hypothetical protein
MKKEKIEKKVDIKEEEPVYEPRTDFQELVNDLGIDETFTVLHRKQTKFNKFVNNVPLYDHYNIMVDLLLLPETPKGFKYLLTAIDLGNNLIDFEPMKTKTSKEAISALLKIFKRKYVKEPKYSISSDNGTEFKSDFDKFCKDNNIMHKFSMPYNHSQAAPIESVNKLLSRILLGYLNGLEIETKEEQTDWTPILNQARTALNKSRERKDLKKMREKQSMFELGKAGEPEYSVNDYVHYKLPRPFSALGVPQNTAVFRSGDTRYSTTSHRIEKIITMSDSPYYRYVLSDLPRVSFAAEQLIKSDKQYETMLVKKIWNKRKRGKKVEYLVWFKGQLKANSVWLPKEQLIDDGLSQEVDEYEGGLEEINNKKPSTKKKIKGGSIPSNVYEVFNFLPKDAVIFLLFIFGFAVTETLIAVQIGEIDNPNLRRDIAIIMHMSRNERRRVAAEVVQENNLNQQQVEQVVQLGRDIEANVSDSELPSLESALESIVSDDSSSLPSSLFDLSLDSDSTSS